MSTISSADEFVVFKFKETGLVALCREVADLYNSGAFPGNIDWDSGRYRFNQDHQTHEIVFSYLP